MNKRTISALAAALGLVGVLMMTGCSDDDKGNNSGSQLTAEEQYALLEEFLIGPDGAMEGDASLLLLGQLNRSYWDGIDETDFAASVAAFTRGKVTAADVDSIWYDYSAETGWWHVYVDLSFQFGADFHLVSRDSVRFEDASGDPQQVPDENTVVAMHGSAFLAQIELDEPGQFLDLEASTGGYLEVAGLNSDDLIINGDAAGIIEFLADVADTTAVFELEVATEVDQMILPNEEGSCPTDGNINATLSIDLDVQAGEEHAQAHGDWSLALDIQSDGMANAEFHSGSTDISAELSVCGATDDSN
ncbi:MAG: hypothetical protein AB1752_13125 [Candidatus Zixiibacteriota bacterium]